MSVQPVRRHPRVFSRDLAFASLVVMAALPGQAANWVPATGNLANMASECGNLCRIFPEPNSDKVIAGVAGVGLWVTTNGGALWTKLGGADCQIRNRPQQILFDLGNADIFWKSASIRRPAFSKLQTAAAPSRP